MQSGLKIAICGKGGVGKTTVCAIWSYLFAQDGLEVLALDGDSNPNLALALGLAPEEYPQPLMDMKELILERTGAQKGALGQYFQMNPKVSDLPDKYSQNVAGVKLLVLGGIEQAGRGCACPEGAFLKALLSYTILQRQEMIIVDLEAGVEFLGRASVLGVDGLVVVIEPGYRSIQTAQHIAKMARDMGINKVAAIVNKLTNDEQLDDIREQIEPIALLGSIKYDPLIQQADLQRKPIFQAVPDLVEQLKQAKKQLLKLIDN